MSGREIKLMKCALAYRSSWIDVRDLGLAHVLAVKTPDASGERIIVSESVFKLQDFGEYSADCLLLSRSQRVDYGAMVIVNITHRLNPKLPAGDTSFNPATAVYFQAYDTSKIQRLFGIQFRTMEEMVKDALEDFKARGWIP